MGDVLGNLKYKLYKHIYVSAFFMCILWGPYDISYSDNYLNAECVKLTAIKLAYVPTLFT